MGTDSQAITRPPVISLLGLICAAQFVLLLDLSIVNVALPTIQRELGFTPADLQWVVTGYALTFGSLLLLGGRAGDVLGRRRLLVLGLLLFGLASLTCGLAVSPLMLTLSRLVQGAGGAFVSPSALALLTTTNAEGTARNRALSVFQASTAAGTSTGVIAGGVLTQYVSWRAIFLVNLPIIAVLLLLIPRVLPDDTSTTRQGIDVPGAALVTVSAAALIYGLSNGQQQGFASPRTVLALGAAVLLAVVFVLVERTSSAPMVPFSYFSSPTHRAAVGATALMGAVIAAYTYFISLYLQRVLGVSPAFTGLALIPATAAILLLSIFATRRLLDRLGVKRMLLLGLTSMGFGQLVLSFLTSEGSYLVNVLPGLLLTSVGMALALPAGSIGATTGVDRSEQGLAGGLLTTGLQIGSAVGLALLATLASARTEQTGSLEAGYGFSYLVATGIVLIAILLVATQLNRHACQVELARQRQQAASNRRLLLPGATLLPPQQQAQIVHQRPFVVADVGGVGRAHEATGTHSSSSHPPRQVHNTALS
jgi:EmrB/QacA subfamily drug resistance transporter